MTNGKWRTRSNQAIKFKLKSTRSSIVIRGSVSGWVGVASTAVSCLDVFVVGGQTTLNNVEIITLFVLVFYYSQTVKWDNYFHPSSHHLQDDEFLHYSTVHWSWLIIIFFVVLLLLHLRCLTSLSLCPSAVIIDDMQDPTELQLPNILWSLWRGNINYD